MKVVRSKVGSTLAIEGYSQYSRCRRPIVHRAGGMLIQAKKEFVICTDLQPDDVFFYYTTTLAKLFFLAANPAHESPMQGVDDVELPR